MIEYFVKDYQGEPFRLFDSYHLAALCVIFLFNLSFIFIKNNMAARKAFRYGMAIVLVLNEAAWHLWNYFTGQWTYQTMLPLHLCSIFVFLSAIMLVTRSRSIYDYAYFLGIGPASQNLLTPDIGIYGFPHFRFWQGLISHGLIVSASVFMTVAEGFRPYWKSLFKSLAAINIYMVVVFGINLLLGSNYMFVNRKPDTPSALDMMGPWPMYLVGAELLGLIIFTLIYIPFFLKDMKRKRQTSVSN